MLLVVNNIFLESNAHMSSALIPDAVKNIPLLSGINDKDKSALVSSGRIRQLPRGQRLFTHGDPVSHFYIILSGNVQLVRTNPEGSEKTIDIRRSGQTLCEGDILDSCRLYRTSAVAIDEVSVLEFPYRWLKESARNHSDFALNLLSLTAKQEYMAEVEAEHQATMSAAQLVACFLQRICVIYDFNPAGFELPYSKTLIASRLGMELETFSRTLSKLKEHGITVEGSKVIIGNLNTIENFVCSACSIAEDCPTHNDLQKIIQKRPPACAS